MKNLNTLAAPATMNAPATVRAKIDNPFCALCFAATCESCGHYRPSDPDIGRCAKHGGWVSPDKWSCASYE